MGEPTQQIERWNARYERGEGVHEFVPSAPLPAAVETLQPGLALDLASGAGRHAIFLAERGWRVVAVEGARAGIEIMLREAQRRGVASNIEARQADVESRPREFLIEPDRYDLICDIHFLDRSLFDEIRDGVRPGGLFVARIHLHEPCAADHRNPAFLLGPGELRSIAESWGWEILHSHEGGCDGDRRAAELIARRPALTGDDRTRS